MNSRFQKTQYGFTLVEMAIVLAIVAMLLGGLLPTISTQMEQKNRSETRRQLDEIQQALTGYAIINHRLPCPAQPNIASGSAGAGVSDCTISTGVLPWATLGTSETDAWGRRYTYTASNSFITSNITLITTGSLSVKSSTSGANIANSIPAVIVSHGINGLGAYTTSGVQIPVGSDLDETDNSNGGTTFVSHNPSSSFDDLVVWISPNILFNRMVSAGTLP